MASREYKTLNELRKGKVISFEGVNFKMAEGEIKKGDCYIAERNTGPKLLTAKEVKGDFIIPEENAYPFDTWECVKVELC